MRETDKRAAPDQADIARGTLAKYVVKTYWKVPNETKLNKLTDAIFKNESTVKFGKVNFPITARTNELLKAYLSNNKLTHLT